MIRYITFKKYYRDNTTKYKFIPKVKYMLKNEDFKYYYTIKNIKLPKQINHKLYEIHSIAR